MSDEDEQRSFFPGYESPDEELLDPVAACGSSANFKAAVLHAIASEHLKPSADDWYSKTDAIASACAALGYRLDYVERRAIYESESEHEVLWNCINKRPDLVPVCIDAIMDVWFTPENWPWGFTTYRKAKIFTTNVAREKAFARGEPTGDDEVIWPRPLRRVPIHAIKSKMNRKVI